MTVGETCAALDELAPPALAYEWDRIGLSIGAPDWPVSRILVALTVDHAALRCATNRGADLIVSHHPLIWEPLTDLRADNAHAALCMALAQARVACFSAHTNLDVAPGGVNDALADLLGVHDRRPLFAAPQCALAKLVTFVPETYLESVREAVCAAGAGVIGAYSHCTFSVAGTGTFWPTGDASPFSGSTNRLNEEAERRFEVVVPLPRADAAIKALKKAHPYEEAAFDIIPLRNRDSGAGLGVRGVVEACSLKAFAARVREALSLSRVRVVGDPERRVCNIAALGGAGGGRVGEIPDGVDVFVTGDIGYHDAQGARARGLALIDAGHEGTERPVLGVLERFLATRSPETPVSVYEEPECFNLV